MGQQQLLLLVLSTVIVGLATVAGIQAFSENQAQASQDALVQRGTSIASDIQGLAGKPTQLGGIDLNNSPPSNEKIVNRLGYDTREGGDLSGPTGTNVVPAQGAGSGAGCTIEAGGSGSATVECKSDDAPQTVTVTVTPSDDSPVSTSFSSS
ncbi:type II secretory pathway pseudopilin PulG [Salinibacter ruber]|uniref:hypothetical protein n=1 Tax=Salinibacter ruber TaxID=146919 RepID=UPI002166E8D6|nr:hypothetical protein [Salinibacter ruber]MCS3668831.1 type II secretory pathway pseudopilin PulG [Salinibacter ruber]